MDTFPIVMRKDEQAHGEYRTRRVILEMYDQMAALPLPRNWGTASPRIMTCLPTSKPWTTPSVAA